MRRKNLSLMLLVLVSLAIAPVAVLAGGSTVFTYEGRLLDGNVPANGPHDFEFSLWDAAVGPNQIGVTQIHNAVPVADGLFLILLDFGANAFDNADRWLAVTVNTVPLTPRQPVTRVPYAIQTRGIFVNQDQTVFVGRDTPVTPSEVFGIHRDTSTFGGMYASTSSQTGKPFYGYAAGGDVDAYHYYDGTTGKWHLLVDNFDRLTVQSDGKVGIGTTAPLHTLHVVSAGERVIFGQNTAIGVGVYGEVTGNLGRGVAGVATAKSGGAYGVYGRSDSIFGRGVYGEATASSESAYGVYGESSIGTGVRGTGSIGVLGTGTIGVRGESADGFAVYSDGDCIVVGTLTKTGGAFKIDHPLDPENKYLQHSFVESPDMMNVYNGNVILDDNGKAFIRLPDYFDGLNRDFRYQLTPMGAAMPNLHIGQEIANNSFQIAGGKARMKVSWQITGIRQDPWAEAHRIEVEPYKRPEHQGKYLNPELYGQPKEMAVHYLPDAEGPVPETALARAQAGQTPNPLTGERK